jgi:TonB-linked SusC/RagA family outer membrane protein
MQLNALCKNGPALTADKPGKRLLTHITGMKITRQTLLCMKITAFILFAFCMQVSATTLAQNVSLSEHKAPLEKVINEIKRQTGYSFFYNQDWLQQAQPVDVQVKNMPLEQALKNCFVNQPFDYAIVNKTIVLKLKEMQPVLKAEATAPISVTGKVTDSVGTLLIGATVTIKGINKATITGENGEFVISAQPGDVLSISFVGYKSVDITIVPANPYINIALKPGVSGLKEVVVSTGYQSLPKERATGSFATVDNELLNRKTSPDVLSRLEGVVPGLLINRNVPTTNNPNGIDINIRGVSTLFSNTQPLIVVDNFPYDGNINNINPNDIENITILKDAAAASIWGVRSGNGVIVITTKKGHRNQPLSIEFNSNVTIGNKPDLYYSRNFLDSRDYIDVEKYLFGQGYYNNKLNSANHTVVSPVVNILADQRAGRITADQANSGISALLNNDVRNDLTKYFYQKSLNQQYALNFRGGGNSNDYIYSVGYDNHLDNLVGNKNDRLTLNAVNNFYPIKNLQISSELHYTQSNFTSDSPVANIFAGGTNAPYPYVRLVDGNGVALAIPKDYNYQWVTDPIAQAGLLDWQYKPLDELRNADNTSKLTDIRIVTGLKYAFFKGFNAEVKYAYQHSLSSSQNYYSQDTYYARNLINLFTDFTKTNPQKIENPIPIGGILQQNSNELVSNRLRAQLNYNNAWASKHQISAILGAGIDKAYGTYDSPATAYGYNSANRLFQTVDFYDSYRKNAVASSSRIPNNQGYNWSDNRFISYFTNIAYTYLDRYTLSASARIDKANLFGVNTNQKSVPLYSTGLSWTINKEGFYNVEWLPELKLRATFGYNGNLNNTTSAFTTVSQLSSGYLYPIPFDVVSSPGNPELRWEKNRTINFGLDFASKENIVTGSLEYYLKDGLDLFGDSPLAPSTGYTSFSGNVANTKGRGVDIVLTFQPFQKGNFKWQTNFLFSYAFDKVSKYLVPTSVSSTLLSSAYNVTPIVGKPVYSIFSYKSAGLTYNTGDPQGYLNGQLSTNYAQIIGNTTSVDSLKFFGSARPTTFGSFRNTISYKALSLSANVTYKLGYYFKKSSISYGSLFSTGIGNVDFTKRWTQPGDELKTTVPSMPTLANLSQPRDAFYYNSESLVDKGDHIRLQDVTLNYLITKPAILNGAFKKINCYFNVNNIGILWRANHDKLDPDTYLDGYPLPRTFSLGINASF